MNEKDVFGKFEEVVIGWITRHKIIVFFIAALFLILTVTALTLTCIAGGMGFNIVYMMVDNAHNGVHNTTIPYSPEIDDQTMNNWNTIIMPVAGFLFNYQAYLIIGLVVGYLVMAIYYGARAAYRWKKAREDKGNGEKCED